MKPLVRDDDGKNWTWPRTLPIIAGAMEACATLLFAAFVELLDQAAELTTEAKLRVAEIRKLAFAFDACNNLLITTIRQCGLTCYNGESHYRNSIPPCVPYMPRQKNRYFL